MIPGSLHYFHLYFLDLLSKKKGQSEFTVEEGKMWAKFDEKYG